MPGNPAPSPAIHVQYATEEGSLPSADEIRHWAKPALPQRHLCALTIRLCDREESRSLNRQFRHKDHATNVLSFVLNEPPGYLGDVVICAPLIAEQARSWGHSVTGHWAHLVIHGILHLRGFDHQKSDEARVMEEQEQHILRALKLWPLEEDMDDCR